MHMTFINYKLSDLVLSKLFDEYISRNDAGKIKSTFVYVEIFSFGKPGKKIPLISAYSPLEEKDHEYYFWQIKLI